MFATAIVARSKEQDLSDDFVEETLPEADRASVRTNIRFVVLGVLCLLSGILYLDRICIAQAIPSIQEELHLSDTQGSYVMMAFTLAYGLFEVPTGRWGDVIGARRVLTRISLWWSAFTALTGACHGLWTMVTVRFLFGAGEAGAFPNVARVLSRWFPDSERGRAQGVFVAASQIGGALAPLLTAVMIQQIGWRSTFVGFGGFGCLWALGFWLWFRDDPVSHPAANAAEIDHIGRRITSEDVHEQIPWRLVLSNPSIWLLGTIMTFASFNSYIYFSWFPKYLMKGRGVEAIDAGWMASLVLACSAIGTIAGGQVVDRLIHHGGVARRRIMGGCAFIGAAGFLVCALRTNHPWLAVALTGCSCFMTQSTQPLWWSCAIGISGKHVGSLFGLMNSAGVFGGLCSQYLVGVIADWLGSHGYSGRTQWDPIFQINVVVLVVAAATWFSFTFVAVESRETPGNGKDPES